MSKQMKASKCLPAEWLQNAEAHYLTYLRETAGILGRGVRASPPRKVKKRRTSTGFFDCCDSDEEQEEPAAEDVGAGSDKVTLEKAAWEAIEGSVINEFRDEDGLIDEFALVFSV
eukprot:7390128-Prymnesium_polylepis.1